MNGLELSKRFYKEVGEPMLSEQFPEVLPYLAVGLLGGGSECFGYDDALSRDHDFEPAFCLFLPEEDLVDRRTAFRLERAYAALPNEFLGFFRQRHGAVGGNRHGVLRLGEFLENKTGRRDGELTLGDWLTLPEYALLEVINGEVFADPYGKLTAVREKLRYLPEDVRRKKLAGHLLLMGQAGQYNFGRCLARGDTAAAQLAAYEFVKSALHVLFLLERTYLPYYKWQFRALRDLPQGPALAEDLEHLLTDPPTAAKATLIETLCAAVAARVAAEGLSAHPVPEMESLAYAVNDTVADHTLRNAHVLAAV